MTIAQEVEAQMHDARGDFPDVDETTLHQQAAENACYDAWYDTPERRDEANEYWQAHFGYPFSEKVAGR